VVFKKAFAFTNTSAAAFSIAAFIRFSINRHRAILIASPTVSMNTATFILASAGSITSNTIAKTTFS
jgi:uncharacterized protein with PQ loop repeat